MNEFAPGQAFLKGGGRMAARIAATDWRDPPLGPIEQWPVALRMALSIMLNARSAKVLGWTGAYYCFFNDAYAAELGDRAGPALGAPLATVWQENWDLVEPIAGRAMSGEGSQHEDMPLVSIRSGVPERAFRTFSFSALRDEDGVVRGVLCTTLDVTARVLAQQKAQDVEARLQLSLDASGHIGTWTVELDTMKTFMDERFARLFGMAGEAARSGPDIHNFINLIHEQDRARVQAAVRSAIESGGAYESEYRVPQPSGAMTWINSKGRVFNDSVTGERRFAGVAINITERKLAEQAVRESEAKFRTIADAMPQMVWSTRPDGFHDYYNEQWYAYTGMPAGSTDGEGWNDMFHPDDQERAWASWRSCLDTGAVYEIEYRLRHHSGQYRWVLGRALPVRDEAGRITRWMGTCTDIHVHKQAEDELHRANRQKDEFLAMLAHELRNPLAPISTSAQLLGMAGVSPATIKRASEVISRQVTHMTSLVDDLLDVSRVTRGLVTVARDTCDMKLILAGALEQTRPLVESRAHVLNVTTPDGCVLVHGDRNRLVQVIANLVSNAAKYTPQHGRIAVVLAAEGPDVRLTITDNGSGMEADLLPHVFDLFTQGHRTPDRSQGGLGLGLALVKNIIGLHDGTVSAHSEGLGKGSEFVMTLPRVMPAAAAGASALEGSTVVPPMHIMLVDDNVDAVQSLAALLQGDGHTVTAHFNGRTALDEARSAHVNVFILDIGLPDIDGYELVRRLRVLPGMDRAHFIALTGYGQSHDRGLALAAGFDHHCIKPINMDELRRLLQRLAST